jgi:hypothetical protein
LHSSSEFYKSYTKVSSSPSPSLRDREFHDLVINLEKQKRLFSFPLLCVPVPMLPVAPSRPSILRPNTLRTKKLPYIARGSDTENERNIPANRCIFKFKQNPVQRCCGCGCCCVVMLLHHACTCACHPLRHANLFEKTEDLRKGVAWLALARKNERSLAKQ